MADAAPGGESAAAFAGRAAQAYALIVRRATETPRTLAVITHGLMIRVLLERHASLPPGLALPGHVGNTSVSVLAKTAPHTVTLLNCTAHLDTSSGLTHDTRALSGG